MAAYNVEKNEIGMVPIEYFPDGMMYYRVLFHEMGHWIAATGEMEQKELAALVTHSSSPIIVALGEYGADIGAYLTLDHLGYPGQVDCSRLNRYVPIERSFNGGCPDCASFWAGYGEHALATRRDSDLTTYPWHPCAEPLAARYERAAPWRPSQAYKSAIQAQTLELYHAIPLTVVRLPAEPCPDMECLARHVAQGVMPVRIRNPHSGHPVLGHFMTEFRVVHDYYGHVIPGNPFGLAGELAAYRQHCETAF